MQQAAAPKVSFVSLGCPKALVDSERIITRLRAEGYELARKHDGADLGIFGYQCLAGLHNVLLGQRDVHVFLLGLDQDAEELLAGLGADPRCIEWDGGAFEMRRAQGRA